MSGWVKMQRDRFKHELFRRGPFCRGYAWDWLVANAAWQDTEQDVNGRTVTVRRGQLCVSLRHLGEVWGWQHDAVARFLTRLKTETMVTTETATAARQRRDIKEEDKKERKETTTTATAHARVFALPGGKDEPLEATIDALVEMACQHSPGGIAPAAWINPGARIIAAKWQTDLGLTPSEIRQVAQAQIARYGRPPAKPEYWNAAMQAFAAAKAAPALETPQARPGYAPASQPNVLAKLRARMQQEGDK